MAIGSVLTEAKRMLKNNKDAFLNRTHDSKIDKFAFIAPTL
jgi:hypothetical protein